MFWGYMFLHVWGEVCSAHSLIGRIATGVFSPMIRSQAILHTADDYDSDSCDSDRRVSRGAFVQ